MGRQSLNHVAWNYCTRIKGSASHLKCNFCDHTMWGGITRLTQHLAYRRGNVKGCEKCPPELRLEMNRLIEHNSCDREIKRVKMRSEKPDNCGNASQPAAAPYEGRRTLDVEAEERAMLERAIHESSTLFESEKRGAEKVGEDEFKAAFYESMKSFREEQRRRGEGTSGTKAGPSNPCYGHGNIDIASDSDYSDFGF